MDRNDDATGANKSGKNPATVTEKEPATVSKMPEVTPNTTMFSREFLESLKSLPTQDKPDSFKFLPLELGVPQLTVADLLAYSKQTGTDIRLS